MGPAATLALTAAITAALDVPYLLATRRLHGRILPLDAPWPRLAFGAAVVYLALAVGMVYLPSPTLSRPASCALLGVVAYAVYNGTVFATHRRYPLWLAAVDTAWGGTLCGLVGWYSDKLGLTP